MKSPECPQKVEDAYWVYRELHDLRARYGAVSDKYKEFKDLKKRVLNPSMEEINLYTDLEVAWEGIRHGRAYTEISFSIKQKENWDGYEAYRRTVCELNGMHYSKGQTVLFE